MTFGRLGSLGAGFGRFGAGRSGIPIEAEALFDRWSDLGVAADAQRRIFVTARIRAELATGIWHRRRKLWVLAAHAEGASYVDWINPSSTLAVPNGTYTWAADQGFTGNGTDGYIDTMWNTATDGGGLFTRNDCHLLESVGNAVSDTNFDVGTGPNLRMVGRSGTTGSMRINSTTTNAIPSIPTSIGRLVGMRRNDGSNVLGAKDGAAPTSAASVSAAVTSATLLIGGNISGTFSVRRILEVSAGASFTDQQLVDDYAISTDWSV